MSYTIKDFRRDLFKEHFPKLAPEEQEEVLRSLPLGRRLVGASPEQIRHYLDRLTTGRRSGPRKPRRKK